MKLPDVLIVTTLNQITALPVGGLAVVLELFSSRKNNYIIGPLITDLVGRAKFTRDFCERSVKSDQEMFVMDYVDSIEDCKPYLEVRVHSPTYIDKMLEQYRASPEFWGMRFQDAAQLFQELGHVQNAAYELTSIRMKEEQISANPNVFLYTRPKSEDKET